MFTLFQKWYLFQRKKIPIQNLTRFEPFNNYKCIFVLSTGRCGTKLLTKILNFSSELWVDHKPSPELAFQSYRAYKYQYTLDQLKTDFSNSRLDMIKKCYKNSLIYCETNNRISLYARAISNIFPNAKFIHLVRHPGEFVRSGIRRGYYTRMNAEISGHLEPRENSSLIEKWSIMSQIEKIAWQWNTINSEIENFKKNITNPNSIKDMDIATTTTISHIENKNVIGIFGDYDVDGATSTAILAKYFKQIKQPFELLIPDRIKDGYGPNEKGFDVYSA